MSPLRRVILVKITKGGSGARRGGTNEAEESKSKARTRQGRRTKTRTAEEPPGSPDVRIGSQSFTATFLQQYPLTLTYWAVVDGAQLIDFCYAEREINDSINQPEGRRLVRRPLLQIRGEVAGLLRRRFSISINLNFPLSTQERGTTFSTEWAGGTLRFDSLAPIANLHSHQIPIDSAATATFLTMAYILAVNPRILADSGGPCVADPEDGGIFGEAYEECLEELTRQACRFVVLQGRSSALTRSFHLQYVTATAIGSTFACLLMGILGNLPVALAPGSESECLSCVDRIV